MRTNLVFYWPHTDELLIFTDIFVLISTLECMFTFKNEYGFESNSSIGFTHKTLQELEFIGEL